MSIIHMACIAVRTPACYAIHHGTIVLQPPRRKQLHSCAPCMFLWIASLAVVMNDIPSSSNVCTRFADHRVHII